MRIKYPKCPKCGQAMIFTFAFKFKEYACLPCNETDTFFIRNDKVERNKYYMNAKKKKWGRDLNVIARRFGGAICDCGDGSCNDCKQAKDENYQFEYWKKNLPKRLKA